MAKTGKGSEAGKALKVPRDLRIAEAAGAFAALRALAQSADKRVTLDGRAVERVDAAGLQALLAGCRLLSQAGKTVAWAGCSAQLLSAAELLGLAEPLGIRP